MVVICTPHLTNTVLHDLLKILQFLSWC